ncbi:forkhead box protein P3a isoform X2 [Brachyhypopomus gauderio]|uniref:forkhead box protein P3a isoform X2 n=1 Tax=Brachyhypopomus gauderio TaxID=698409 RepID=UPI004041E4B7
MSGEPELLVTQFISLSIGRSCTHVTGLKAMLHNGVGEIRGQAGSSRAHSQQHLHQNQEEESPELSRSHLKSRAFSSPLTSAQCAMAKSPCDKSNKQCLQFKLQRPSVLRKGSQALPRSSSLSNQSVCDYPAENICKAEVEKSLPDNTTSDGSRHPRGTHEASGPSLKCTTAESPEPSHDSQEGLLFAKGICKWPGCKGVFKEYTHFLKHLYSEHAPGDKTIDQWKIQRNMVQHLENQLTVEKQRLQAMYLHLFDIRPCADSSSSLKQSGSPAGSLQPSQGAVSLHSNNRVQAEMLFPGYCQIPTSQFITGIVPSIEYYKYTNIRPPFTYAAMIRWAILESPEKQLTLNDIYHWFTRMFSYFRHNTATWKNAVRHNLSLHKCFVRVNGGKGSVWTVNEAEYLRRKGQKIHRDQDMGWMAHYSMFYS